LRGDDLQGRLLSGRGATGVSDDLGALFLLAALLFLLLVATHRFPLAAQLRLPRTFLNLVLLDAPSRDQSGDLQLVFLAGEGPLGRSRFQTAPRFLNRDRPRSEEHTSELQSR